jgi:pimeloyl-ACP methyl ester carboxylesterase
MAKRTVGTPLCYVLRDRFDNAARLSELAAQTPSSRVQLYHGQEDGVVPFSMGQSLAQKFPMMITFHPVAGAGHNDLLQRIEQNLATVLSTLD